MDWFLGNKSSAGTSKPSAKSKSSAGTSKSKAKTAPTEAPVKRTPVDRTVDENSNLEWRLGAGQGVYPMYWKENIEIRNKSGPTYDVLTIRFRQNSLVNEDFLAAVCSRLIPLSQRSSTNTVTDTIDLSGCTQITDKLVRSLCLWLESCGQKPKKFIFDGCPLLTRNVLDSINIVKSPGALISAVGTNIASVPKGGQEATEADLAGCPRLDIPRDTTTTTPSRVTAYQHASMVICNHSTAASKLLPFLVKLTDGMEDPVLHGILTLGDHSVHVVEADIDGPLFHTVASPRPGLICIPFEWTADLEEPVRYIKRIILHFIVQGLSSSNQMNQRWTFLAVGMHNGPEIETGNPKLKKLETALYQKGIFKDDLHSQFSDFLLYSSSVSPYPGMETHNFIMQALQEMEGAQWGVDISVYVRTLNRATSFEKGNAETLTFIKNRIAKESSESRPLLFSIRKESHLAPKLVDQGKFHAEYTSVFQLVTAGKAREKHLVTADDIREMSQNALGPDNQVYEQLLGFLHLKCQNFGIDSVFPTPSEFWHLEMEIHKEVVTVKRGVHAFLHGIALTDGQVLQFLNMTPPVTVTDIPWFLEILKEIEKAPSKAETKVTCLHPDTPVWKDKELWKTAQETLQLESEQLQTLMEVLLDCNLLCRVPSLRTHHTDPRYYLLPQAALHTMPVDIGKFLQSTKRENLVEIQVQVVFPSNIRDSIPMILLECTKLGRPLALGKEGLVVHHGAAEVVISVQDIPLGKNTSNTKSQTNRVERCLQIDGRMFIVDSKNMLQEKHLKDYLWSIVYLYCDVIEYKLRRTAEGFAFVKFPDNRPANRSVCAEHRWTTAVDSVSHTVCVLCSNCSGRGWGCHYNGIRTDSYLQCMCNTSQICCRWCGLCKACVEKLWGIASYLRPGSLSTANLKANPGQNAFGKGMLETVRPLQPFTCDTVELLVMQPNDLRILLKGQNGVGRNPTIEISPGLPRIRYGKSEIDQETSSDKESGKQQDFGLSKGDRITLKLKVPQNLPDENNAALEHLHLPDNFQFHYAVLTDAILWHSTGIMTVKEKYEFPAVIESANSMSVGDDFEIELIDCFESVYIGIKFGKLTLRKKATDWYMGDEIRTNGRMRCSLGCNEEGIFVEFTLDGQTSKVEQVCRKESDYVAYRACVWLQPSVPPTEDQCCAVRLLDAKVWHKTDSQEETKRVLDVYEDQDITIVPDQILKFPRVEPVGIAAKHVKSTLYLRSNTTAALAFKIKVSDPKKFVTNVSRGVIPSERLDTSTGIPVHCVPIEVTLKYTGSIMDVDLSYDKLLVEYMALTDEQYESTTKENASLSDVMKNAELKRVSFGWGEPDSDDAYVRLLPSTSSPTPFTASYQLDVSKNDTVIHSIWIPQNQYTVAVTPCVTNDDTQDNPNHPDNPVIFIMPKMPAPVSGSYSELQVGMFVVAKVKPENLLSGNEILPDDINKKVYAMAEVSNISEDGAWVELKYDHRSTKMTTSIPVTFRVNGKEDKDDIHPWYMLPMLRTDGITTLNEKFTKDGEEPEIHLSATIPRSQLLAHAAPYTLFYEKALQLIGYGFGGFSQLDAFFQFNTGNDIIPDVLDAAVCQPWNCGNETTPFQVQTNTFAKIVSSWTPKGACVTLLPRELTFSRTDLLYPSLFLLFDVTMLAGFRVCKYKDDDTEEPAHVMDAPIILPSKALEPHMLFSVDTTRRSYIELSHRQIQLPGYGNIFEADVTSTCDKKLIEACLQLIYSVYATAACVQVYELNNEALNDCIDLKIEEEQAHFAQINNTLCCSMHVNALSGKVFENGELDYTRLEPYTELLHNFKYSTDTEKGISFPIDFAERFPNIQKLALENAASSGEVRLPERLSALSILTDIVVVGETLKELPGDIGDCPRLESIVIPDGCNVTSLPGSMQRCSSLKELHMPYSNIQVLPPEIGALRRLVRLNLEECPLSAIPKGFGELQSLIVLNIKGISFTTPKTSFQMQERAALLSSKYKSYLGEELLTSVLDASGIHESGAQVESKQWADMNARLYYECARLGLDYEEWDESGGFPTEILKLKNLTSLTIGQHAIRAIPSEIAGLKQLEKLDLENSLQLETLPATIGQMSMLQSMYTIGQMSMMQNIKLDGCPSLHTPPEEVVSRGTEAVLAYMRRMSGGYTENWRTKLMVVGLGGVGKTSLLRALMSGEYKSSGTGDEAITDGIDIKSWTVKHDSGATITFSTWDFAGQNIYYNTHQFFLSSRAVYLLLWTGRNGYENGGLEFWLSSIQCHAPKAPVFLVGTHADKVTKSEIPKKALQEAYPQICGFHYVSALTGMGIKELEKDILNVTVKENYMGERVPSVYLELEESVLSLRNEHAFIKWKEACALGIKVGIYNDTEMKRAVQFLHDLGTVQYFDNVFLREYIVINPQWIVDIMSRVVSVKDTPIMQGQFSHDKIPQVWSGFPKEIHDWLLRLTETFDLTFPVPNEAASLVPCLLPETEPDYKWPSIPDSDTDHRETLIVYRFQYLPSGLFNRTQVRLCQFSDGRTLWKRGSLLTKNGHHALIRQLNHTTLEVKVQGPRPENILFLIHEAIEGLINQYFRGVHYDYKVPCPDCVPKIGVGDAHLFKASRVRLAASYNAPFLQCQKYFHTISMAFLQATMPPSDSHEFEMHLERSVQGLASLRNTQSTDIFVSYCCADVPKPNDAAKKVHPKTVVDELRNAGFSCWYQDDMHSTEAHSRTIALQDSKVMLIFMSDEYEKCEHCRPFCLYALETLNKPRVIVSVGTTVKWAKTHLGCVIGAQELYIAIKDGSQIKSKVKAIKEKVQSLLQPFIKKETCPAVFISYCWNNSKDAVQKGTRNKPEALGKTDPRNIKKEIEKRGLACWLDIEQVGQRGLFEDITGGIRQAEVVVACVSKEYASSVNCMMELRFAAITMRKPVVFAVVGQGEEWKETEIGALKARLNAKKVNFQDSDEKDLFEKLVERVKALIPEGAGKAKKEEKPKPMNVEIQNISFKEEYELAQRKFLRHLEMLASNSSSVAYPRLFVLDIDENQANGEVKKSALPVTDSKWNDKPWCIKLFCENEAGWHEASTSLKLGKSNRWKDAIDFVRAVAPYIARMYALLHHSSCDLTVTKNDYKPYMDEINGWAKNSSVDMSEAYNTLQEEVMHADESKSKAGLKRCHLPTGKVSWLCPEHQAVKHVRVLNDDVSASVRTKPLTEQYHHELKEYIEKYDHMRDKYRTRKGKPPQATGRKLSRFYREAPLKPVARPTTPMEQETSDNTRKDGKTEDGKKTEKSVLKHKLQLARQAATATQAFSQQPTSAACAIL